MNTICTILLTSALYNHGYKELVLIPVGDVSYEVERLPQQHVRLVKVDYVHPEPEMAAMNE